MPSCGIWKTEARTVKIWWPRRVWGKRLANMQRALEDLNQEWIKKERELGNLFKAIEANYLSKL